MNKVFIAVLAALCAVPALAGDAYLSTSVGASNMKFDGGGGSLSGNATGVAVAAGYQFNGSFGAEVGATRFGNASMQGSRASGNTDNPGATYAAVTATWPATASVSVYAKAGLARTETNLSVNGAADGSASHTSMLLGLGLGYALTPKASAFAEYQDFGTIVDERGVTLKAATLSAGVRYTF